MVKDKVPTPPKEPKPVTKPPVRKEVKPLKPLTKLDLPPPKPPSREKSPTTLVKPVAPPPKARTPTPPRPETPLPNYVTQFQGTDWFDKYYPNFNENVCNIVLYQDQVVKL